MSFREETRKQIKEWKDFENNFCKVIDTYFTHNEKPKQSFSTNSAISSLYSFIANVDCRFAEVHSKINELQAEIEEKDKKIKAQKKEIDTLKKAKKGAKK